jgi:hypothetical protein
VLAALLAVLAAIYNPDFVLPVIYVFLGVSRHVGTVMRSITSHHRPDLYPC